MLTMEQLKQLRSEIVLGSLYTSDYKNSLNIDSREVQDFFDGYVEYLWEIAEENGGNDIDEYDTQENLESWYNCFDEEPLRVLPSFEVFKETFSVGGFLNELYACLGEYISKDNDTNKFLKINGTLFTDEELYDWLEVYDIQVLYDYAKFNNLVDKG